MPQKDHINMLNWPAIDTVLLDMDGTVLDLHFDNHFWLDYLPRRFAETHGHAEHQARAELHQRFAHLRGQLNWYCLDYWSAQLDLDITALKREIQHLIAIRPDAPPFLRALRQSGRQLWLVTNAHRDSLDLKMACTGIEDQFDRLISSHDFQVPKEDPAFWTALQAAYPFEPERALMVDDTTTVLQAAQNFGIGQQLCMLQPDSRQPPRTPETGFPGVVHFDELLPALTAEPECCHE